ncbi:hypothetical protein [Legionella sp. CNM-4043-24]|uniref:hypothetical protein n=1 Tax=Legionella sp. CNM-4043-24 TaxID=3421646 RepID=UPI00403AB73A
MNGTIRLTINDEELSALSGLPHLQQLLYLRGIKPYVDYATGMVGIKRGISYQSLAEALYVEPHQGIKSGSPSKDQIRRAITGLEKVGLLRIESMDWKLIFQCRLASLNNSGQNKAATKQHDDPASLISCPSPLKQRDVAGYQEIPAKGENNDPAIPLNNSNYFVFLYQHFETFWESYPLKKSRQKAWEQFQALRPSESLAATIIEAIKQQVSAHDSHVALGHWVPGWKFPANWLAQHCWEDEITTPTTQEFTHATYPKNNSAKQSVDPFWDSCKDGATYTQSDDNIFNIANFRKEDKTYG